MDPASSCLFLGGGPGGTGGENANAALMGIVDRSAPRPATPPLSTLDAGDARAGCTTMDPSCGAGGNLAAPARSPRLARLGDAEPPGSPARSPRGREDPPRSSPPPRSIPSLWTSVLSGFVEWGVVPVPALGSASMHLTFRVPRTPFASAMARMHSAAVDAFENLANATPLCGTARTDSRCFRSLGLGFRAAASPLGLASPSAGPFSSSPSRSPSFFGLDLEDPPGSESLVSRSSNARVSVSCPVPFGHTTKSRDLGGSSSAADDVDIPPAPTRSSADDIPRGRE